MNSDDREPMLANRPAITNSINKSFAHKKVLGLSIAALVLAKLSFITGVGLLVLAIINQHYSSGYGCGPINPAYMATGVWCGILYGASSIVGIKAVKPRSPPYIVALMVLSTLSATFACLQLVVGILGAVHCSYSGIYRYYLLGCHAFLAVLGLVEMILFAFLGALSCRSACCDPSPDYMADVLETKQPKPEPSPLTQPTPLVPGSQIVYAPSGAGGDMKPFLMVPIKHPEMVPNMQSQLPVLGQNVMMQAPVVVNNPPSVSAPPTEQDDQPLIEA